MPAARPISTDLSRALARRVAAAVIGPTVRDGAIVLDEIDRPTSLPAGWTLETLARSSSPGAPAGRAGEARTFDYPARAEGHQALDVPGRVDALAHRRPPRTAPSGSGSAAPAEPAPLAFVGVRACELAALAVQDRVLAGGPAIDPDYAARRATCLVVAVECAIAASTCFCTSMGTGPEVTAGADLVLDRARRRVRRPGGRRPRASACSRRSAWRRPARTGPTTAAARTSPAPARRWARRGIARPAPGRASLANLDHPRWAAVAERCLACANCTLVCPTCFCTSLEVRLRTSTAPRRRATRTWDSCFTDGFAQVAGGSFRPRHRIATASG